VQIRLADLRDAESLMVLINIAFRKAEAFLIDHDRIDLDSVKQFLHSGKFLLAEDGAALLGCVYVEPRGERAYLGLLSDDPDCQRAGLGSTLMSTAENYCAKAGCKFMDLQIISVREELPRFYRRLGYSETGIAPLPPNVKPKQPCHFVKMSKALARSISEE
jgi:GNAT superfamily N-acetyltransferase